MSQLLPNGLTLFNAPYTFLEAIKTTLVFLSWQENLERKYQPPKRIWLDGKKLDEWFKKVEKLREDEMKGKNNPEEWSGEMVDNDAVSMLVTE